MVDCNFVVEFYNFFVAVFNKIFTNNERLIKGYLDELRKKEYL